MRKSFAFLVLAGLALVLALTGDAQEKKADTKATKKKPQAFTSAAEGGLDYQMQGEYAGKDIGCQVIALGSGKFQAVLLPGGLPGAGWDGKSRMLMDGKLDGERVVFGPATGKRKYMAPLPQDFSATAVFPPAGQAECKAVAEGGRLSGSTADGGAGFELKKIERRSPTLGATPPPGAIVLFDGKSAEEWKEGKVQDGLLPVPANSKRSFGDFQMHLEFCTPFVPTGRGQSRGNSGVKLHGGRYEIQILDSFGLDGKNNECGGLYGKREPSVNMCLPPLAWQTFDIEYRTDPGEAAQKVSRLTVLHNGVKVHDRVEIPTGQGPMYLQNHGNPVFFRNIWLVE